MKPMAGLMAAVAVAATLRVNLGAAAGFQPATRRATADAADTSPWSLDAEPGAPAGSKVTQAGAWLGVETGLAPCPPFGAAKLSPMLRRVKGLAAVLETRDVRVLDGMMSRRPAPGEGMRPDEHAERLYTFAMCDSGRGEVVRRAEVMMSPDGSIWVRAGAGAAGEGAASPPASMDREKLLSLVDAWPWYGGDFERADEPPAKAVSPGVQELPHPYIPGRYLIDQATLSKRFLGGRSSQVPKADRVLEIEKLYVRLPAKYTAREPAGLLIWIDAGDEGRPPPVFFGLCDANNLIIAGFANCGNTRPVANRYQLALDAVATVGRRYHVDKRRVYATGVSGGGRIASVLQGVFPDVFTGALPIVGLNTFERVPVGGGRFVPPAYARPQGRLMDLLRQRRIATLTGGKDFNFNEITIASQVLRGEGVQAKVFDTPEMGHELPPVKKLAEAFEWVDEPWKKARAAEVEAGERELKAALARLGEKEAAGPTPAERAKIKSDADRALLVHVTEVAPWTPAAWEAEARLREAEK